MSASLVRAARPSIRSGLRDSVARHPYRLDAVAAVAFTFLSVLSLFISFSVNERAHAQMKVPTPVGVTICVAIQLVTAFRRRFPIAVLAVTTLLFVGLLGALVPEGNISIIAVFLAFYSVGVHGRSHRNAARTVSIVGTQLAGFAIGVRSAHDSGIDPFVGNITLYLIFSVLINAVFYLAAWLLGDAVRVSNERRRSLEERTAELERSRVREAETAVRDERVRIARELHDVVAHHVSVMGIQAGAARMRASDEVGVTTSLMAIEESSRVAVAELQRLMRLLRADGDRPVLDALPNLGRIADLIEHVQSAGLQVDIEVSGEVRRLPDAVELSGYRIVQEALTNTLKHGGQTRAVVRLRYEPRSLAIDIEDEGGSFSRSEPTKQVAGGNGIIGMRERVTMLGGVFSATRRRGGGFAVHAVLPLSVSPGDGRVS